MAHRKVKPISDDEFKGLRDQQKRWLAERDAVLGSEEWVRKIVRSELIRYGVISSEND